MNKSPNRIRRLKHIEAFSAVISTGSISAAARQLGVSQPAVSQLIKALEEALGAPLFVRRNGAVFPTARAEALREDAVDLLAHLDRFQAQLSHQNTGVLSTIRLSASVSILTELLPGLISGLAQQDPYLKFYVSSVPQGAMVSALVQGHIDYALHSRALDHPGLHNENLIESPQVAVMARDHPLAAKKTLTIQDLNGCRFISSTKNDPSYHDFNTLCRLARVSVNTVFQSPFSNLNIQMVRPMQAVTFSNELVVRSILARMPDLSMRYVEGVDLKTPIYLACADWQNGTETHQLLCEEIRNLSLPNAP
ncbi:MAG: hypothetical protein CSA68_04030 [Rhodobacterales bacterium]|nr:MAG: hypothetical protein CSA68_04030 [Rhodobacterales bacterium]